MNQIQPDIESPIAGDRGPEKVFEDFLRGGRLMLQRDRRTGHYVFYPRYAISGSEPEDLEWIEASGRGVVYAATIARSRERTGDYNIVIVELAEGPRLMSTVVGIPPDRVHVGMAVVAQIESSGDRVRLVFGPSSPGMPRR